MEVLTTAVLYGVARYRCRGISVNEGSKCSTAHPSNSQSSSNMQGTPSQPEAGKQPQQSVQNNGWVQNDVIREMLALVLASFAAKVLLRCSRPGRMARGAVLGAHRACKLTLKLVLRPFGMTHRRITHRRNAQSPTPTPAAAQSSSPQYAYPSPATEDPPLSAPVQAAPSAVAPPTPAASHASAMRVQPHTATQQQGLLAQQDQDQQQQQQQQGEGGSGASRSSRSMRGPSIASQLFPSVVVINRPQRLPVPRVHLPPSYPPPLSDTAHTPFSVKSVFPAPQLSPATPALHSVAPHALPGASVGGASATPAAALLESAVTLQPEPANSAAATACEQLDEHAILLESNGGMSEVESSVSSVRGESPLMRHLEETGAAIGMGSLEQGESCVVESHSRGSLDRGDGSQSGCSTSSGKLMHLTRNGSAGNSKERGPGRAVTSHRDMDTQGEAAKAGAAACKEERQAESARGELVGREGLLCGSDDAVACARDSEHNLAGPPQQVTSTGALSHCCLQQRLQGGQQGQQQVWLQVHELQPPLRSAHQRVCVELLTSEPHVLLPQLPCAVHDASRAHQQQKQHQLHQQQQDSQPSLEGEPAEDWVYSNPGVLGLPPCVGAYMVQHLDADGVRVLRSVCRALYFEATRTITQLVITPDNLATLVAMPLHEVMPHLRVLIFRVPPALGGFVVPGNLAGPQAPVPSLLVPPPLPAHSTLTLSVDGGAEHVQGTAEGGEDEDTEGGVQAMNPLQDQHRQQQPQLHPADFLPALPDLPTALLTPLLQGPLTPQQRTHLTQLLQQQQQGHQQDASNNSSVLPRRRAPASQNSFDSRMVMTFAKHVLPHLKDVAVMDFAEAPLHSPPGVWQALMEGASKPDVHLVLREPSAWVLGAMDLLGMPDLMKGDGRDHYPALYDALRVTMDTKPSATVDLLGVTIRRHTAARLPLLCEAQCMTSLTIFGKSVAAVPHGHRLATHLKAIAGLKQLRRLELLSYEDVSDMELAPLANCPHLQHLYIDSLFIKQAMGPVFPSLTSLTAARIKFILRPLTTIFPSLTNLRLGVLHSELNKKISSASLSCLAGCSEQLTQLCVCPVLWKGQWQVLPILPGLRRLVLVHCKDLSHLREVLQVVGRSPSLEQLELHSASPAVAAWPGANDNDTAGGGGGHGGNGGPPAAMVAATAAAAGAAAAAAGGNPDVAVAAALAAADAAAVEAAGAEVFGSVVDANLYAGLQGCSTLKSLVLQECSGQLVRHLAGVDLPALQHLGLHRLGPALRWPDLQAAVLALPSLHLLELHASGEFGAAAAASLPETLAKPALQVDWRSRCKMPSLTLSHD